MKIKRKFLYDNLYLKDTSSVSSDSEGYERLEAAPRSRSRSRSREVRSEVNDTSRDVNDVSRETNDAGEEGKKKKKKNYEVHIRGLYILVFSYHHKVV